MHVLYDMLPKVNEFWNQLSGYQRLVWLLGQGLAAHHNVNIYDNEWKLFDIYLKVYEKWLYLTPFIIRNHFCTLPRLLQQTQT